MVSHHQGEYIMDGPPPGPSSQPSARLSDTSPLDADADADAQAQAQAQAIMKITRGHSCVLCQQRKVRCDKKKPCANCLRANVECRVVAPHPPRRRKKKPQERDLVDRLVKYEVLLAEHGIAFEPLSGDVTLPAPAADDDVASLGHDLGVLKTSPSTTLADLDDNPENAPASDGLKWFSYTKTYRTTETLLRDSSDDEIDRPTIHNAFDATYNSLDGFPFFVGPATSSVTHLHPPAIQIFQLWQVYLNNVNPLLRITHANTLQGQIIEASANLSKIPPDFEALMFAIYFIAVTSLFEDQVQSMFDEDKAVLLKRYHAATQQALVNARLMKTNELSVLQAYFLYLLCIHRFEDPRSLFCWVGIAVRIATRLALHRDAAPVNLSPIDVELRRRLWWQIVGLDRRIGEITGSTVTALSSTPGDCKVPLNINDSDLNPHAKDPPQESTGATEMLFCLSRVDLTLAYAPGGARFHGGPNARLRAAVSPAPSAPPAAAAAEPSSSSASSSAAAANPCHRKLAVDVDAFSAYIDTAYLKHCDAKIPLHLLTLLLTRQEMGKLRLLRLLGHSPMRIAVALSPPDREALAVEAIHILEAHNALLASDALRGFVWYTYMYFPFPAYMVLIHELRARTTGELCERAWRAICQSWEHRDDTFSPDLKLSKPMHIAVGHQFVKAWDAHEAAERMQGRSLPVPRLIASLRERSLQMNLGKAAKQHDRGENAAAGGYDVPAAAGTGNTGTSASGGDSGFAGGTPASFTPGPPAAVGFGSQVVVPSVEQQQQQQQQQQQMDHHPSGVGMLGAFDPFNPILGQGMSDVDFNAMDWSYLIQEYGGYGAVAHGLGMPSMGGEQQ